MTELRAGDPLHAAGVTIVPLEETRVTVHGDRGRVIAGGVKRAVGVVITDAGGTRALDDTGHPLDLEELRGRVAGL